MTRPHYKRIECPNCGVMITAETSFGRWIRNRKDLPSGSDEEGWTVIDQDYAVHCYKKHGSRQFQAIMWIEVKTHGALMTTAQSDTLHVLNQLIRNRRQTPTKENRWQAGNGVNKVYSVVRGHDVWVRSYGVHLLQFSHLGPDDSSEIRWNTRLITLEQLVGLLRFDLDPDTLGPLDLRSHHAPNEPSIGIDFGAEAAA